MTAPAPDTREVDAIVARWNATLATGDPVAIAAARRSTLATVADMTLRDDPRAAAAGYRSGGAA